MIRLVMLSVIGAGLMYTAYTALLTDEFEGSDNTEPLLTPWALIDPAAQNSRHAIVPEEDLSPTAAFEALPSPIEVEKDPSIANAQVTLGAEKTEHIGVPSPASIREGPSTSTAIIGVAQP